MATFRDYIPELDGLRDISAMLVVLGHYGLGNVIPGTLGVTVFFFISGFLVTRQLLAEKEETGGIVLSGFFMRRLLRLWPALLVAVPVASFVNLLAGGSVTTPQVAAGLFYVTNYFAMFQTYHTGPGGMDSPLVVLWSLAVEVHFYLLFPLIFLILPGRKRLILLMIATILAVTIWRNHIADACIAEGAACTEGLPAFRTAFATEMRLDSILYGCLLAVLLTTRAVVPLTRLFQYRTTAVVSIVMLLASLLIRDPLYRAGLRYTLQGIAIFLLVGCLLFGPKIGGLRRALTLAPVIRLGKWSYSLYLWHLVVLVGAVPLLPASLWQTAILEMRPSLFWLLVVMPCLVIISVFIAALSYDAVEKPGLRLKQYLRRAS